MPRPAFILAVVAVLAAHLAGGEATAWCVPEAGAPDAAVGAARIHAPDGAYAAGAAAFAEPGGQPVGAWLLWSAPGEPATVLFDRSGRAERYRIEPAAGDSGWRPKAGVVGESRERVDGPVDTWDQVEALWQASPRVMGRDLLPHVHWGVNPFADTRGPGFLAEFTAWIHVAEAGSYRFAIASDDASFLAVDGHRVVDFGGWHGIDPGLRGEKHATLHLQPGPHELRYRYAQNGENPLIVLAWQPPGAERLAPMPPEAFAPVCAHRVERIGDGAWFAWETVDDCAAGEDILVGVALRAALPPGVEARWRFDDGHEAAGAEIRHAFARPSPRRVRLAVVKDGAEIAACERTVLPRPRWTHHERWNDHAHARLRDELSERDVLALPAEDAHAIVRYAAYVGELAWVERIGVAIAGDPARWGAAGAPLLSRVGFLLQDDEIRRTAEAAACWRALLALPLERDRAREQIALHLAGLLVHGLERVDEAAAILASIDAARLDDTERRLLTLYRGDAALAAGDAGAARARYAEAGDAVARGDLHYSVRRRARLESARAWVARREYESALGALGEIEWETPVDRLGPETGLLKVRAWLGRGQHGFALACCRRLLVATAGDDGRAEVLAMLAEVCLAIGRRDDAAAAVAKLTQEFPYSEPAARSLDLMRRTP